MYAMSGMVTQLHLIADEAGSYAGSSANLSGVGFSGMTFEARAVSQADFDQWVLSVQQSSQALTTDSYAVLAIPSTDNPVSYYARVENTVFSSVISKFMMPAGGTTAKMQPMH